jgi:hypothetical protein
MPVLSGQDRAYPVAKSSPARIGDQIMLVNESVLKEQWTHTVDPVNAPKNAILLNPGQCVHIGVVAIGDNRDEYLKHTNLSFSVRFAGQAVPQDHALLTYIKKMKPEGGDFVTSTLVAGGVKAPDAIRSLASLGVSASNWCVPADARDGSASVTVAIEPPGGKRVSVRSTVEVETFATGSEKKFKDVQEFGQFLQTYYQEPHPARLLPAIKFMVAEQSQTPREGQAEIVGAFLSAALRVDAAAAHDLLSKIGSEPALVRAFGLLVLRAAGYDISPVLNALPKEEQAKFQSLPALEDPFDLTPSQALFHHLDMLWGVFGATGQYEPVKTIASALAWRSDYEAFAKMKNGPDRPPTITPSIVRGVVYTAAGWSLRSFQTNDGLVADYIEYMLASEETPPAVSSELRSLSTNPAFKGPGAQ